MAKKTGHIFTSRVLFSALSSTDRSLSSLPRDEARASIDRVLADVGIAPVDAVLKNVAAGKEKKQLKVGILKMPYKFPTIVIMILYHRVVVKMAELMLHQKKQHA